ncbi:MAG: mismatch repair protein MutL protein [candidate division TM6 bacterium GW2011_GWF2_37_49]|nr:MAG: mismatch repair protein MutL protein [candidate division TM6 bacterium GW2011_GWF2_37_49]
MNKIKVLQADQAQKIAAGEVIERPSNVIKEIIENSIDAGATQISLFIEDTGKNLIRVVDNGCGMTSDDAQMCFLPHATSKITSMDELENIDSFGFRGEALASISAVSRVTLITKLNRLQDSDAGIKVEFVDGKVRDVQPASCNVGTDISIHSLFYNVPVRKKFLKQDETEWNLIQSIFHAFCLSHTAIHFKLFRDDKMVLNAPTVTDIKTRVSQIWGNNISQNLLELTPKKHAENWLDFYGYISNHNFWRYGRTHIFFFVNNRWIKNSELSKALLKGYLNVLPPAKFPAAFIFATVDKTFVDVNCHPKKEEVRFLKPATVQARLQEVVKATLEINISAQLSPQKTVSIFEETPTNFEYKDQYFVEKSFASGLNIQQPNFTENKSKFYHNNDAADSDFISPLIKINSVLQYKESVVNQTQDDIDFGRDQSINQDYYNFKIIGQLFNTYIVLENGDDLIIIDQHAAHERILYEKMLKNFERKDGVRLMFPEILKLTEHQINLLLEHQDFLNNQGIEFDVFGKSEISIKSGPVALVKASLQELILEIVNFIDENEEMDNDVFRKKLNEHTHSHLACKSAIKAGDELSVLQMQNLVQELQKTNNRFICVHGRPTTWTIKRPDLEKNFKRR